MAEYPEILQLSRHRISYKANHHALLAQDMLKTVEQPFIIWLKNKSWKVSLQSAETGNLFRSIRGKKVCCAISII